MNQSNDPVDPLLDLVTNDAQSIDRGRLAAFLKPFVIFDQGTKATHFLEPFSDISSNDAKIEVVLLISKARAMIFADPEGMNPKEIIAIEIMPMGSVKSSLKRLSDSRKIKKNAEGRYYLPNYRLNEVIQSINQERT